MIRLADRLARFLKTDRLYLAPDFLGARAEAAADLRQLRPLSLLLNTSFLAPELRNV